MRQGIFAVVSGRKGGKPRLVGGSPGRVGRYALPGLDLGRYRRNIIVMTVLTPTPFPQPRPLPERVHFDRHELSVILSLYGRMVAAGEWRDYGISALPEVAVFSIFRRTAEFPLYRIEKRPKLRNRQGMYAVVGAEGQVLRRGHDLAAALRVLEQKLIRPID